MLNLWTKTTWSTTGKTCLALLGVLSVFSCSAYAVYATSEAEDNSQVATPLITSKAAKRTRDLRPPAPRIVRHPTDPTTKRKATFAFTDSEPRVRFQCRITGAWKPCSSSVSYCRLSVGAHHFQVRAIDPSGRPSPAARFDWRVVTQASENFSIHFNGIIGGQLYPGADPGVISVTLANPNGVGISVTSVVVSVSGGPAGCESARNVSVAQSNVSSVAPVEIPAHSSVTLPAQGYTAPTIQLLNLPVNQDACQGARFPLTFTGSAHS